MTLLEAIEAVDIRSKVMIASSHSRRKLCTKSSQKFEFCPLAISIFYQHVLPNRIELALFHIQLIKSSPRKVAAF